MLEVLLQYLEFQSKNQEKNLKNWKKAKELTKVVNLVYNVLYL